MKMHDIEFVDLILKRATQCRCPIKSSQQRARKVSDLNAFQINGRTDWHRTVSRPVNVRSKDLDVMPPRRQSLAQTMSRKDWPAITHSRQVARDDVEDPHKSTFQNTLLQVRLIVPGTVLGSHRSNWVRSGQVGAACYLIRNSRLWISQYYKRLRAGDCNAMGDNVTVTFPRGGLSVTTWLPLGQRNWHIG